MVTRNRTPEIMKSEAPLIRLTVTIGGHVRGVCAYFLLAQVEFIKGLL
jgi:hypothetical protein